MPRTSFVVEPPFSYHRDNSIGNYKCFRLSPDAELPDFAPITHNWDVIPVAEWWHAVIVGLLFFLGQCFTYMAFRYGDVSVATPIFGVKILIVAVLSSFLTGQRISTTIWIAAFVATAGIILVHYGSGAGQRHEKKRVLLTVVASLLR